MTTDDDRAGGRSSSPPRPLSVPGVLWRDGRATGPVRLPEDGDRFIERFNATYGEAGLRMTRAGDPDRASQDEGG